MQEKTRKNFVLLSKVAKEKKYAQEYLGLLARRGDIGSIRIGKRWYTTWAWFEEFLENSQKKKIESFAEVKIAEPIVIKKAVPVYMESEPAYAKAATGEGEKVFAAAPAINIRREERVAEQSARIAVAVKTKQVEMASRKNFGAGMGEIRRINEAGERGNMQKQSGAVRIGISGQGKKRPAYSHPPMEAKFRNISVAERNRHAIPYPQIKFRKKADVFSPNLSSDEEMFAPVFGRLAFATSFAMILLLVAASGYFVWSGGLLKAGQVAGASDERNGGFPGIKSGSEYVFTSAGDRMKQSLSLSKVVVQAAMEKGN